MTCFLWLVVGFAVKGSRLDLLAAIMPATKIEAVITNPSASER